MARRRRNKRKHATPVFNETHAPPGRTVKVKPRKEKPCITRNPKPVA